jgi:hypothetical protein
MHRNGRIADGDGVAGVADGYLPGNPLRWPSTASVTRPLRLSILAIA